MADQSFSVVVIGGGPGGYIAAIRAAQLGLKVALVEKSANLGGTCLNVGCIPSKALLSSTEHYHFAKERFAAHGIVAEKLSFDLPTMLKRKDDVVATLRNGVKSLMKKNKIVVLQGIGRITGAKSVSVTGPDGAPLEISAENIIIASGSESVPLPFLPFDGTKVISSTEALSLSQVPKKLLVIGAGAIGLELSSVWSRLGAEVTILEFLPRIALGIDGDLAKSLQRFLERQGLNFSLSTKVISGTVSAEGVKITAEQEGKPLEFSADQVLVAVGRRPVTSDLSLEKAGIELTEKGRIRVNDRWQTACPSVYAIGDVINGPMLAHKAEEEGVAVAELIAGRKGHVNTALIPGVIYTSPEAASVGLTEDEAKQRGLTVKVGRVFFQANGRAIAGDMTEGFVKLLADPKTDKLLGAHILAANASELIAECVSVMEFGGSAEDIGRTIHAHPTMAEAIKEAALAVDKQSLSA